jgi:hypothetical protein
MVLKAGVWVCTKVLMIFMVEIFLEECEKLSTPCFKDLLTLDLYKLGHFDIDLHIEIAIRVNILPTHAQLQAGWGLSCWISARRMTRVGRESRQDSGILYLSVVDKRNVERNRKAQTRI